MFQKVIILVTQLFACSRLLTLIQQAEDLNIPTPILTFHQPLWLKAMETVKALYLKVDLILEGFHMLTSYVDSIGKVISEYGLCTELETVYGKVAVIHILIGKIILQELFVVFSCWSLY